MTCLGVRNSDDRGADRCVDNSNARVHRHEGTQSAQQLLVWCFGFGWFSSLFPPVFPPSCCEQGLGERTEGMLPDTVTLRSGANSS